MSVIFRQTITDADIIDDICWRDTNNNNSNSGRTRICADLCWRDTNNNNSNSGRTRVCANNNNNNNNHCRRTLANIASIADNNDIESAHERNANDVSGSVLDGRLRDVRRRPDVRLLLRQRPLYGIVLACTQIGTQITASALCPAADPCADNNDCASCVAASCDWCATAFGSQVSAERKENGVLVVTVSCSVAVRQQLQRARWSTVRLSTWPADHAVYVRRMLCRAL
jgi:hypothetical protein